MAKDPAPTVAGEVEDHGELGAQTGDLGPLENQGDLADKRAGEEIALAMWLIRSGVEVVDPAVISPRRMARVSQVIERWNPPQRETQGHNVGKGTQTDD